MLDAQYRLENDRDRVKANQLYGQMLLPAVLSRRSSDGNFLVAVDIAVWRSVFIGASALHFDNDKPVRASRLPADEIDFMQPAAAAPVPLNYEIAFALQIAVSQVLSSTSQRVRRLHYSGIVPLPQLVEAAPDWFCEQTLFYDFKLKLHHLAAHDVAE